MNMQKNLKVEDEVFSLASELIRRFPDKETHECNFAQELAEFMNDDDFLYELPETPHYLERSGLAKIQSTDSYYAPENYLKNRIMRAPGDTSCLQKPRGKRVLSYFNSLSRQDIVVRGFFAMSFNLTALEGWFEKHLLSKTRTISGVAINVPEGWKWFDELHGIYQFGALGRVEQGRGDIGKIFRVAMNLFEETPQAISITALSERTGIEKKVIRTRLGEINKKLRKLGLNLVGGGGYYRIKSTKKNEN